MTVWKMLILSDCSCWFKVFLEETDNYKTSIRGGAAFRFEELGSDSVKNLRTSFGLRT